MSEHYVIGLDFGSDSMRALLLSSSDGNIIAEAEFYYPRWKEGRYCSPLGDQFRQHPRDYLEGIEFCVTDVLDQAGDTIRKRVRGISVGTTGSTPVAVDRKGVPLALYPEFEHNPNAMFFLWKDHTAQGETEEINHINSLSSTDYLKYVGGTYSSEWFWAKFLHMTRADAAVRRACYSWVEHCDWVPFLLTGGKDVRQLMRSRCAAGHKALWAEAFGGLPKREFFRKIDPVFGEFPGVFFKATHTCDKAAGYIAPEWASVLRLPENVLIGVGGIDAHFAAVGAGVTPGQLCKVMGTSTCDMLVVPGEYGEKPVRGICGQVNGSIIPGMTGMEAGQSAFGDIFNWYAAQFSWMTERMGSSLNGSNAAVRQKVLRILEQEAERIAPADSYMVATDWFNGRRTPEAKNFLKATLSNIDLGIAPGHVYKGLVEASCFGAKHIVEHFRKEGLEINSVLGVGGIAHKSRYIMQTLSDILELPVYIGASRQASALGAGIFAAVVSGAYDRVDEAVEHMTMPGSIRYEPNTDLAPFLRNRYEQYLKLCSFSEKLAEEDRYQEINQSDYL
ncbi:ribulokinase [Sinomicrobium soli]|nr:ribulokinase [Sinomicrobium sp. N-1-3-6]